MATVTIYILIYLFFAHYVADFVLQSRWMGKGKSKKWLPLLSHIAVYTTALGLFTYPIHHSYGWWVYFMCINSIAHLCVDTYTSQLARACYESGKMGAFWRVIGFDQFLHGMCLIASVGALFK